MPTPRKKSASAPDSTVTTVSTVERVQWSGSALTESNFFNDGIRTLNDTIDGAPLFIEWGIVLTRGKKISVMSLRHAQDYVNRAVTAGSMARPFDYISYESKPPLPRM